MHNQTTNNTKIIVSAIEDGRWEDPEFLAQMERNNRLLKAKNAKITNIPEIKKACDSVKIYIGLDPVTVAQEMMKKVLKYSEQGSQIDYSPIRTQVLINADALIKPMAVEGYSYRHNNAIISEVAEFFTCLSQQKDRLIKQGFIFEQRSVNSNNRPYYTFSNDKREKYDIYIDDLAYGSFGYVRRTLPDGTVHSYAKDGYWE